MWPRPSTCRGRRRNTVGKTTDAAAIWGNLLPRCRAPPALAASASSTPSASRPRPHSSAVRAASLYLVSCLISTRSWVRIPVGVPCAQYSNIRALRPRGGIGRHRDLKSRCLRACGFESRRGHHSIAIQTLTLRNSPGGRLSRGPSPTSCRGGRFSSGSNPCHSPQSCAGQLVERPVEPCFQADIATGVRHADRAGRLIGSTCWLITSVIRLATSTAAHILRR